MTLPFEREAVSKGNVISREETNHFGKVGTFISALLAVRKRKISRYRNVNRKPQSPSNPAGRVSVEPVGSPRLTATTNNPSRPQAFRNILLTLTAMNAEISAFMMSPGMNGTAAIIRAFPRSTCSTIIIDAMPPTYVSGMPTMTAITA